MITLKAINGKNMPDILTLRVGDKQKSFVVPNDMSIMEAYIALAHNGRAFPFGIYDGDEPVGFCMIGFGADDDWDDAPAIAKGNYNLWRFMIDRRYQGKGYGRAAMERIMDFISSGPCGPAEYCWLSYEPENTAAKALYHAFGFRETGDMDGNEIIAALKLHPDGAGDGIRYAAESDRDAWFKLDKHIHESGFERMTRDRMGYVLTIDHSPIAILRYDLFWGSIPFLNLLAVKEEARRRGYGKRLMARWEEDMKKQGHGMALTSTQANEEAQHFYRRLGYRDCGTLDLPFPGYEQPTEIFLGKAL